MSKYTDILKQHWFIACSSGELKTKPYACEILSTPIVLFRNGDDVTALLDRCPHRNAPLSKGKIRNGSIECPYHGWQFNDNGQCIKIPGLCKEVNSKNTGVTVFHSVEKHGFIWINLSEAVHSIYQAPFLENKEYHNFIWKTSVKGSLVNVAENFLDGMHTHFVHGGLVRSEGIRNAITARVKRDATKIEVKYTGEGKQSGIISKWFEKNRKDSYGRFILPSIAEIEYCSDYGTEFMITAYITPASDNEHQIYAVISIKRGRIPGIIKQFIIAPFLKLALKQDRTILKLQHNNIQKFGEEKFVSTEIDLIRPHLEFLLKGGSKEWDKMVSISL